MGQPTINMFLAHMSVEKAKEASFPFAELCATSLDFGQTRFTVPGMRSATITTASTTAQERNHPCPVQCVNASMPNPPDLPPLFRTGGFKNDD